MKETIEHIELLVEALDVTTEEDTASYLLKDIPARDKIKLEISLAQESLKYADRITLKSFFLGCIRDRIK